MRWRGKCELLLLEDLVELMREYPDVWIILDSKWDDQHIAQTLVEVAQRDSSVLDRVVPHLISDQHTEDLLDIYPFPERMIAIYQWQGSDQDIVGRSQRHGVEHVMMWHDSRWSESTQATLEAAGMRVWVHTPHDAELVESFRAAGIGVYSDGYIGGCSAVVRESER